METVKIVLMALALAFAGVVAYLSLGIVLFLIECIGLVGIVLLGGVCVVKLAGRARDPQLKIENAERELEKAARVLEQYKRRLPRDERAADATISSHVDN